MKPTADHAAAPVQSPTEDLGSTRAAPPVQPMLDRRDLLRAAIGLGAAAVVTRFATASSTAHAAEAVCGDGSVASVAEAKIKAETFATPAFGQRVIEAKVKQERQRESAAKRFRQTPAGSAASEHAKKEALRFDEASKKTADRVELEGRDVPAYFDFADGSAVACAITVVGDASADPSCGLVLDAVVSGLDDTKTTAKDKVGKFQVALARGETVVLQFGPTADSLLFVTIDDLVSFNNDYNDAGVAMGARMRLSLTTEPAPF